MSTKRILSLLTVASASLLALPAAAQMYPGEDVIVNPGAIPGSPAYGPGYRVHKPHHHHRVVKTQTAATDTVAATPAEMTTTPAPAADSAPAAAPAPDTAPTPPPPAKKRSRHTATAAASGGADAQSGGLGFSFGDDEPPAPPPAANTRTASNDTGPAAQPAKPGKPDASTAGLAKRGSILFEHASTDPQPTQMDGIKLLAGDLNSALEAGATQIQLMAFGGAAGDKGSDAKRISLKRALAIRQLLIDNGVPSNKIITKAMGGATDNGEPDRVDIYVRA
jgi:outer membrane protein OmpA-like peptidoglycan-associated protein